MTIKEESPMLANPDIVFREEEAGAFLFDPDTGELKCLNPLGGIVWKLLENFRSFNELKALLEDHYPDVPGRMIHQDVAGFLEELLNDGYVGYRVDGQDD